MYKGERQTLVAIYVARGLEPILANQVAQQLIAGCPCLGSETWGKPRLLRPRLHCQIDSADRWLPFSCIRRDALIH
jgi:hypothetical protein